MTVRYESEWVSDNRRNMHQDLVNIKKAIIAFDVNDRILPKDNLPAS
jgi:hypothetical protein